MAMSIAGVTRSFKFWAWKQVRERTRIVAPASNYE
jgi:hypothetical protein